MPALTVPDTRMRRAVRVAGVVAGRVGWLGRWCARHRRWLGLWAVVAAVVWLAGDPASGAWLLAVAGLGPALIGCAWSGVTPRSYERLVVGPVLRVRWRWHARRRWAALARVCGLAQQQPVRARPDRQRAEEYRWVAPKLQRVRVRGHLVKLTIRARAGQTLAELEAGAVRLASTFAAVSHRTRPVTGAGSGCTLVVELVMRDALTSTAHAVEPDPHATCEGVRLGRTQAGGDWWLQLRGRHTLVAGCSGAGKGSVLWGVCGGLAPAVRSGLVRLWGIDLKRGVELAMGAPLFSAHAYAPAGAIEVLRTLMTVIDERGQVMAGATRLHEPTAGDPLHVLVIDELAALTAYADLDVRRDASRLLSEILAQGRALGVVVLACVQDPRKEVVAMRGLFTQTVALRLRSADETAMVLGDGMAQVAPAHRIGPGYPGTAWVVDDTGAADRVRADYWSDALVREVSGRYPAEHPHGLTLVAKNAAASREPTRKPRSPRTPGDRRPPRVRREAPDGAA